MFHESWLWPEPDNKFLLTLFPGINFFMRVFRVANDSFKSFRYWCTGTDHTKSNTRVCQTQVSVSENIPDTVNVNGKKKLIYEYIYMLMIVMSLPDAMHVDAFKSKLNTLLKLELTNTVHHV